MMWNPFRGRQRLNMVTVDGKTCLAPIGQMLLGHDEVRRPVYADDEEIAAGAHVAGQAGSGKTNFNMLLAYQQIQRGGGLVYAEGWMHRDVVQSLVEFARLCGRERDVLVFSPDNHDLSQSYNPVQGGTPAQVADRVTMLLPSGEVNPGSTHYRKLATHGVQSLVAALQLAGLKFNCMDLAILLTSGIALDELASRIDESERSRPELEGLELLRGMSQESRKMSFGGIAGRLYQFGSGKAGHLMNSYTPGIDLREVIAHNKIVYVALPSMGKASFASNVWRLFAADLADALAAAEVRSSTVPFLTFEDEMFPERATGRTSVSSTRVAPGHRGDTDRVNAQAIGVAFKAGTADEALRSAHLCGLSKGGTEEIRSLQAGECYVRRHAGRPVKVHVPFVTIRSLMPPPARQETGGEAETAIAAGANFASRVGKFFSETPPAAPAVCH